MGVRFGRFLKKAVFLYNEIKVISIKLYKNMKKIVLITILSFLLFSFGIQVSAEETDLPSPGLLPDSPFYFLETIAEEIITFFTFGDLKKAERYAALAAERLAEVQAVVEKGKPEFVEKTLARYESQLNNSIARAERAQVKGQNTEQVMAKVGQATSKHLEVLAEVYEKIPDQAKPAIENAMKASVKGHEKAVEALKAQDALGEVPEEVPLPMEVPVEVRERIQRQAQEELEEEKAELQGSESFEVFEAKCIESGAPSEVCASLKENLQSSKSIKTLCAEAGGTPEMCDQLPSQRFESFEQIRAFCVAETGATSEICVSLEAKCREFGITTANECFLFLSISSIKAFTNIELQPVAVPARPLSEEEMEERRQREEESRTLKYQTPEGTIEIPIESLEEGVIEIRRVESEGGE